MARFLLLVMIVTTTAVCSACSPWEVCGQAFCLAGGPPRFVGGVGAAQGLDVRDGLVWIIGDARTGVARAFTVETTGALSNTGSKIDLTVDGEDRVPHPTGLTHQEGIGTFLGNTVGGRGEILALDWGMATAQETLDGAILYAGSDNAAHNGSRPELVWVGGRWLLATADYGGRLNELRLYDPDMLMTGASTTDPDVLVFRAPSPPYVQSLHYWQARDVLVLVQNRNYGSGWKLTLIDLEKTVDSGSLIVLDVLRPDLPGELEGFHFIDDDRALMVTSDSLETAYLVTLTPRS